MFINKYLKDMDQEYSNLLRQSQVKSSQIVISRAWRQYQTSKRIRSGKKLYRISVPKNTRLSQVYIMGTFTSSPWKDKLPLKYSIEYKEFYLELWLQPGDMFILQTRKQMFVHSAFHKTTITHGKEYGTEVNIICPEYDKIEELKSFLGQAIKTSPRRLKFRSSAHYVKKSDEIYEDRHFLGDYTLGIADGVSAWRELGIDSGKFAEEFLDLCRANLLDIDSSASTASNSPRYSTPITSLKSAAKSAFIDVRKYGSCTFLLASISGETIKICNLGDSSLALIRFENDEPKLLLQTSPQVYSFNTPYQIGKQDKLDTKWSQAGELADEYEMKVAPGDLLITATDGLWDNLYISEILELAKKFRKDPALLAKSLSSRAYIKSKSTQRTPFQDSVEAEYGIGFWIGGKPDDITVLASLIINE